MYRDSSPNAWLLSDETSLRCFHASTMRHSKGCQAMFNLAGGARSGVRLSALIYQWVQCRIRIHQKSSCILVLTTIGYDSGMPQTDAIGYFEKGVDFFVVASNHGSDQHSSWYLNLRVHPKVYVQIEEVR